MLNKEGRWETFDDYVLDFALDQMRRGIPVAIVTLVEVDGSSPWKPGAQMAVTRDGNWVGYLSGGCLERAIVVEARRALARGRSHRIRYGSGSEFMDIQLPCGSAVELVVDVDVKPAELKRIDTALRDRNPACLPIPDAGGPRKKSGIHGPFSRLYLPRKRLLVAGLGPVAAQLARLARTSGFAVTLASPDAATLSALGTVDIDRVAITPSSTGSDFALDSRTAIVFAFHDHEWERNLLPEALRSDAFYIGAMGSARTQQIRLQHMAEAKHGTGLLTRIHGPAGLMPHLRGASEIAISILAEIVQVELESFQGFSPLSIYATTNNDCGDSLTRCRYGMPVEGAS